MPRQPKGLGDFVCQDWFEVVLLWEKCAACWPEGQERQEESEGPFSDIHEPCLRHTFLMGGVVCDEVWTNYFEFLATCMFSQVRWGSCELGKRSHCHVVKYWSCNEVPRIQLELGRWEIMAACPRWVSMLEGWRNAIVRVKDKKMWTFCITASLMLPGIHLHLIAENTRLCVCVVFFYHSHAWPQWCVDLHIFLANTCQYYMLLKYHKLHACHMPHASNAVIWGGNIFCSFAFEDSLVEAYDQHVSPVLGGNSTLRNEQKRKRHLESWCLGKAKLQPRSCLNFIMGVKQSIAARNIW